MSIDIPAVAPVRRFLVSAGAQAWLTGGTLRDILLGMEPADVDIVTAGPPEPLARGFADESGGSFFVLSDEFQTCRVVSSDGRFTYDFAARRGASIEDDLALRDFTINAMAVPLAGAGSGPAEISDSRARVMDPHGGAEHLAQRMLVTVSDAVFSDDPLRMVRGLRLEKQLGFKLNQNDLEDIRSRASISLQPAPERTLRELSLLLASPGSAPAIRRLDEAGLLESFFPEIVRLKGVSQNEYHHLDVFEHTLAAVAAMDAIITDPESYFPGRGQQLSERLDALISGNVSMRFVICFAELFHDSAKPDCRFIDDDGQVRFFEHDRRGAEIVSDVLLRLRASSAAIERVAHLVRRHMRFEGLLQQDVASRRARFRYLRATEPTAAEAIMMSVADRLSVRGKLVSEADIERHMTIAREMMEAAFAKDAAGPAPRLLTGDEIMRRFGLAPGPMVGRVLEHIREEQAIGEIRTAAEAEAAAELFLQGETRSG